GLSLGLSGLITAALDPGGFPGCLATPSDWQIPVWDFPLERPFGQVQPMVFTQLEALALSLRGARILLDNGSWFLICPPALGCILLYLTNASGLRASLKLPVTETNSWFDPSAVGWRVSASRWLAVWLWLSLAVGFGAYLYSFALDVVSYLHNGPH